MMAYDFEKWVANEALSRRNPWLRRIYAAPFVLFPIGIAIELGDGFGSPWLAVAGSLLMVAGILCAISVAGSPFLREAWKSKSWPPAELDERERLVVAQAQAKSYAILAIGVILALSYRGIAEDLRWWLPSFEDVENLTFPLIAMIAILPIVIAEWTVPLPPHEEEG